MGSELKSLMICGKKLTQSGPSGFNGVRASARPEQCEESV